jgi:hypothetical protein
MHQFIHQSVLTCRSKANDKYKEGEKIMLKEVKTAADYDRAAQLFSEAITLL